MCQTQYQTCPRTVQMGYLPWHYSRSPSPHMYVPGNNILGRKKDKLFTYHILIRTCYFYFLFWYKISECMIKNNKSDLMSVLVLSMYKYCRGLLKKCTIPNSNFIEKKLIFNLISELVEIYLWGEYTSIYCKGLFPIQFLYNIQTPLVKNMKYWYIYAVL